MVVLSDSRTRKRGKAQRVARQTDRQETDRLRAHSDYVWEYVPLLRDATKARYRCDGALGRYDGMLERELMRDGRKVNFEWIKCVYYNGYSVKVVDTGFQCWTQPIGLSTLNSVYTSNNVEATSSNAASRTILSTKSNVASTLFPFLATMLPVSKQIEHSICFDFVQRTKFCSTLLPKLTTMSKQHSTLSKESLNL